MAVKRKPISKKVRFEVFKRDKFQCQYCRKSSPDVILNVHHIYPVTNGDSDELVNMITSSFDCNQGKQGYNNLKKGKRHTKVDTTFYLIAKDK